MRKAELRVVVITKIFRGISELSEHLLLIPLRNTLYVATKTIDNSGNFYAYINALDLRTGQHKSGSPHLITAQVNGTGNGSVSGKVSYQAKFQNQRPALLLYNSTVYVASASHCDWGPYHGWILGFDATTLALNILTTQHPTVGRVVSGWQDKEYLWETMEISMWLPVTEQQLQIIIM